MKAISERRILIFFITVFAIMAKPCIVFASQSVRNTIHKYGTLDTRRAVRKRNEYFSHESSSTIDDILRRSVRVKVKARLSFLKRIQFALLTLRSLFVSISSLISSRHSTVFQVSPHSDQYKQVSVIRI